jgi:gliding motility-associated protein GldM
MGHGKETPRQKMIGMMYLVLTALLALNVSKDILEAFVLVDESLIVTTENFAENNKTIYGNFEKAFAQNKNKVKPWKDKADEIKKEADDLYKTINDLKIKIVKTADKETESVDKDKVHSEKIKTKDNTDIPAHIMVGDNNNGEGKKLKEKISKFREHILSMIDKKDGSSVIEAIKKNLNTNDPPPKEGAQNSWESEHFEHLPLIAVTTIMSKMQSDIRNAESEIARYLYNKIESGSFKFNKLEPTIIPNSNYILKGNEYSAEVFLGAFDTTQIPTILVDGRPLEVKNGRGIYKTTGGAPGVRKWGGLIKMKATDGTEIERPFNAEYQVADVGAVISPTKMNVFYIGVDNPVAISVAGVPADKIFPTITNGAIKKVGNDFIVNPRSVGNALVTVTAEIDGKKKSLGAMEFRVKNIPDPVAKVANKKSGSIDRNTLLAQTIVLADLENFDFDARFTVTEFTVSANVRGFSQDISTKSNKITEAQKNIIRSMNRGDKVYFNDIKAVGPDGKQRELSTVYFKIQ